MVRARRRRAAAGCLLLGAVFLSAVTGCPPRPKGLVGPNADAIESATMIDYPSERLMLLRKIAGRDNLTPAEQIYLADAICVPGGFHKDQADALVVLIENPRCELATRQHVRERLRTTRLGRNAAQVIEALGNRSNGAAATTEPATDGGTAPK